MSIKYTVIPLQVTKKAVPGRWTAYIFKFVGLSCGVPFFIYQQVGAQSFSFNQHLWSWPVLSAIVILMAIYFVRDALRLHIILKASGYRLEIIKVAGAFLNEPVYFYHRLILTRLALSIEIINPPDYFNIGYLVKVSWSRWKVSMPGSTLLTISMGILTIDLGGWVPLGNRRSHLSHRIKNPASQNYCHISLQGSC